MPLVVPGAGNMRGQPRVAAVEENEGGATLVAIRYGGLVAPRTWVASHSLRRSRESNLYARLEGG